MRMRPAPYVLAAILGVATSLLVACGGTNRHLIPTGRADRLQSDFDRVASAVDGGDCAATARALASAQADFARLPVSLDRRLRSRLADGITNLEDRAPVQCSQQQTQTQTQPTTTSTTPTPTTTEPVPTTTTTTPTTTTPPTDTGPTTTPTTGTNGTGGAGADGSGTTTGGGGGAGGAGDSAGGGG
jgi:hypothetical protein